jgi:hypothetical protein
MSWFTGLIANHRGRWIAAVEAQDIMAAWVKLAEIPTTAEKRVIQGRCELGTVVKRSDQCLPSNRTNGQG